LQSSPAGVLPVRGSKNIWNVFTALRSDSAAYQAEIINYCEGNDIQFAIGADLDQALVGAIKSIAENDWKHYQNGALADTIHAMEKSNQAFRLIVIRRPYQGTLFSEEI